MEIVDTIKGIAEANLEEPSFFIVDVISKGVTGRTKFIVLLDGDNGVTIDDCAKLSRKISFEVETHDLIENAYVLEVSSPGLDHPLSSVRQYKKNVGRKLKIRLKEGDQLQGKLEKVSDQEVVINKEKKVKSKVHLEQVALPFDQIEKANVLVSFK